MVENYETGGMLTKVDYLYLCDIEFHSDTGIYLILYVFFKTK